MATFDERAQEWDGPEHIATATAVSAAIRSAVPLAPTMRALEIGAGTGLLGLALVGGLGSLVLSDPSVGMREVAEAKVRKLGLSNVEVIDLDLMQPDAATAGGGFDLVISQMMIHHVEDTSTLLRAVFGLLAVGGRVAMADLDAEDGTFHDPEAHGIHHRGFDRIAIGGLAKAAGFTEIVVRDAAEIERHGRAYPLFLLTARKPLETDQAEG
jgi:cyclopropane fatty-acyl-phospholipid synthase-like methyltransferase